MASVQANAQPAPSGAAANAGSAPARPGLNSFADQPLSPQVLSELMSLYNSLHGGAG